MQTVGALEHVSYNEPGTYSYEQVLQLIRRLGLGTPVVEQQFRRMVFNVVARNQDDHVKNIAFLMDREGAWSLAPAYDVIWAWRPGNLWLDSHQMSINGKRDRFTVADLRAVATVAGLKRGRADAILADVVAVVARGATSPRRLALTSAWPSRSPARTVWSSLWADVRDGGLRRATPIFWRGPRVYIYVSGCAANAAATSCKRALRGRSS